MKRKRYKIEEFDLGIGGFNGIYRLTEKQVNYLKTKYTVKEVN